MKITPREKRRHVAGLFSRGVIFTHARVSLAVLSLRKNGDYSYSTRKLTLVVNPFAINCNCVLLKKEKKPLTSMSHYKTAGVEGTKLSVLDRADKGWAVKRTPPSKKV